MPYTSASYLLYPDSALDTLHRATTQHRSPPEGRTRDAGQNLARALQEPRYWDSPDALRLMDLSPAKQRTGVDSLRLLLQKLAPDWMLDQSGRERKHLDRKKDSKVLTGKR